MFTQSRLVPAAEEDERRVRRNPPEALEYARVTQFGYVCIQNHATGRGRPSALYRRNEFASACECFTMQPIRPREPHDRSANKDVAFQNCYPRFSILRGHISTVPFEIPAFADTLRPRPRQEVVFGIRFRAPEFHICRRPRPDGRRHFADTSRRGRLETPSTSSRAAAFCQHPREGRESGTTQDEVRELLRPSVRSLHEAGCLQHWTARSATVLHRGFVSSALNPVPKNDAQHSG